MISLTNIIILASFLIVVKTCVSVFRARKTIHLLKGRLRQLEQYPIVDDNVPYILLLFPLFKEQDVLVKLVGHIKKFEYPSARLKIIFITTEKEAVSVEGGFTTADKLRDLLTPSDTMDIKHIHYPRWHEFRADQLNLAVSELKHLFPPNKTYIGVYNADSLPDKDTLMTLARDACSVAKKGQRLPPAYQQPAHYFVPKRTKSSLTMHPAAIFQTLWTLAHYIPRLMHIESLPQERKKPGDLITTKPYSFLGHGEFIRMDILSSVGGFPSFAYADGLLMGWVLAMHGIPIRVLPTFDHAETPRTLSILFQQHAAWFLGLSNVFKVVRRLRFNRSPAEQLRMYVFAWRRIGQTLLWAFRGPAFAGLLLISLYDFYAFSTMFVAICCYVLVPTLYLSTACSHLSSDAPCTKSSPFVSILLRASAGIITVFADGCGFWYMLYLKVFTAGTKGYVNPDKTER